jgi:hypothetical protein
MSVRPHHPPKKPHLPSRRELGAVALGLITVVGLCIPVEGAAVAADHAPHHVSTPLERSLEAGTIAADMEEGTVTEADVEEAGEHGLTLHGHRIEGWTEPTAEQQAAGERMAAQLRADPSAAARGGDALDDVMSADGGDAMGAMASLDATAAREGTADGQTTFAPPPLAPGAAAGAGITDSKHWWNGPRDYLRVHVPHVYLNGPWFKAIVTGGVAAGMIGVCAFFDLSKVACGLVGVVVAASAELLKNTACARNGMHFYYPLPMSWLSYC